MRKSSCTGLLLSWSSEWVIIASGNNGLLPARNQAINPSYKSHNAPVPYQTMHHFVTEMCIHAHFCYKMVHHGIWDRYIVGFVEQVYFLTKTDILAIGPSGLQSFFYKFKLFFFLQKAFENVICQMSAILLISWPIPLLTLERIFVLHLIIFIQLEVTVWMIVCLR